MLAALVMTYTHIGRDVIATGSDRRASRIAGLNTDRVIIGVFAASGASAISHPDLRWDRCDLKTLNLLPNVLAAQVAKERGAFEAMLIRDGVVTEGSKTNFFGVVHGALRTHPCDNHILPGITRSVLRDLAREVNVELEETPIRVDEIPKLTELFLTGTTTDVMPIVALDDKPVGNGKPGELTRKLQGVLAESLASDGD